VKIHNKEKRAKREQINWKGIKKIIRIYDDLWLINTTTFFFVITSAVIRLL
jgi:hypothetical protein